jgi:serine/threonine-protein kinase RsbW
MVESGASLVQDGRRGERLELRVPITPTQLPAVRAMVGDLAMRMDYDLDAVEDLRLAVDEASAILSLVSVGDTPLTVVFETSRAGLHIEAWVPTVEGKEVPRDGFGWAVLATLVDAVDTSRSTTSKVPGGDGTDAPVAVIVLDKYLPGQLPEGLTSGAGQSFPVAP